MNFHIRSDASELISQLELLTLGAELAPSTITIDRPTASINIPMTRKHYSRKQLFLGLGEGYQRESPETTESILMIRDVLDHEFHDRLSLKKITLLFGVRVSSDQVYLCSTEESAGLQAFELLVKIRSYDIELRDIGSFA